MNRYSAFPKYERPEYLPSDLKVQQKRPYMAGNYVPGTTNKTGWWYTYDRDSLRLAENYKDGVMTEQLSHRFGTLNSVIRFGKDTVARVEISSHNGYAIRAKNTKRDSAVLHGRYREWYTTGHLFFEATFKNGVLHGIAKSFHRNGNLKEKCRFIRGSLHGNYLTCNENGQREMSFEFKRDKLHGWCYLWDENQQVVTKILTKDSGIYSSAGAYKHIPTLRSLPKGGVVRSFKLFADKYLTGNQLASPFYEPPTYIRLVAQAIHTGININKVI